MTGHLGRVGTMAWNGALEEIPICSTTYIIYGLYIYSTYIYLLLKPLYTGYYWYIIYWCMYLYHEPLVLF